MNDKLQVLLNSSLFLSKTVENFFFAGQGRRALVQEADQKGKQLWVSVEAHFEVYL